MSTIHIPIGSVNVALTFPDGWRVRILTSAVATLPKSGIPLVDFASPNEDVACDVTAAHLTPEIATPDLTEQFFRRSAAQYSLPVERTGRITVGGEPHFTADYTNTKGQRTRMYSIHHGQFELAFACYSQDPAQQALAANESVLDAIVTSLLFEPCSTASATTFGPGMSDREADAAGRALFDMTQSITQNRVASDLSTFFVLFLILAVIALLLYHYGGTNGAIVTGVLAIACFSFAALRFRELRRIQRATDKVRFYK